MKALKAVTSLSGSAAGRELLCRARLACADRAFRRFCDGQANRMRQHTDVLVPFRRWEAYVDGVGRWLAWHAIRLRSVNIRFEVRIHVYAAKCCMIAHCKYPALRCVRRHLNA